VTEEILLYTNPVSRGRIALWMLEEVGVPFRVKYLAFGAAMKNDAYMAINPLGKVPAIVHNGRIVTEAAAICCYLADTFPDKELAPPPGERGAYYQWLFFTAAPLEATLTNHVLNVCVPEELRRSINYSPVDETTAMLDALLSKSPYVTGDSFSAADVLLGTQLGWYLQYGIIEKRPAFLDYVERLAKRPACQRAKTRDEAALASEQAAAETRISQIASRHG
jgi:glutathione S-transferase